MSIELLREAAALMRERADMAAVISAAGWTDKGYVVIDGASLEVASVSTESEAEHIASWHPAVALAVADWLDVVAACLEREQRWGFMSSAGSPGDAALAVARAYLGRDT